MTVLSSWVERANPTKTEPIVREAGNAERALIANALAIPGCSRFTASYTIAAINRGRFRVTGEISADLVRTCVVTLDDFEQTLDVPFEIEFWPADQLATANPEQGSQREVEIDALSGEDPEPIVNGRLEIGPLLYQFVAAEMDPFPRHPDAELERTVADTPQGGGEEHPFSALSRLKREDGSS